MLSTVCQRFSFSALGIVGALIFASCTGGNPETVIADPDLTPATVSPDPQPQVQRQSAFERRQQSDRAVALNVVDETRPTEPIHWAATPTGQRELPTMVLLPPTTKPGPAVVFAHGLGSHPWDFGPLLWSWADAGFVVIAPRFPLTSTDNPEHNTEVGDLSSQPGDVTFVLDAVMAASDNPESPLFESVSPGGAGIAGWSLGGATALGVLFEPCCTDTRFAAGIILASADLLQTGEGDFQRPVPTLVIHGDADEALAWRYGRWLFGELAGPTRFITLRGATHDPPYQAEPSPWDTVVTDTTIAFWQATLADDQPALRRLTSALDAAGDLVDSSVRFEPPQP